MWRAVGGKGSQNCRPHVPHWSVTKRMSVESPVMAAANARQPGHCISGRVCSPGSSSSATRARSLEESSGGSANVRKLSLALMMLSLVKMVELRQDDGNSIDAGRNVDEP